MYGWTGNVLRIDLTRKEVWRETLPEKAALAFVGGRGLNASYLYRELQPRTDPLGPDSKIMISGGPCNGTLVPGSTRFTISFKSPLTGLLGDSNSGSTFGVSLKYAGYDLLIIQGKAEAPTYVWIDGEAVQFRPAAHLMGKTTGETRRAIESEIGNPAVSVISIGPAGERLVKIACVIGDLGRAAGRSGAGAVFGSKNLKAIAVRGQRGVRVADRRLLEEAWRELVQAWQAHEALYETRTKLGTAGGMVYFQQSGILPTKNYQRGSYECFSDVHPRLLAERYFLKPKACFSCPVPCQHLHIIDRGPYAGESGEGLELGQLEHFSSRIMVNDLDVIVKAAILCNEYGVDIFEAGQIIGFAMECYDRRILTAADLDGIELEWGNGQGALELIKKVGLRQGAGRLFADGVSAASIAVGEGSDRFVLVVKGQAVPSCDARGAKGWGLGYAVSSRGADHCRTLMRAEGNHEGIGFDPVKGEIIGEHLRGVDPLAEEGKGEMVKWYEDVRAFQNCMEMCIFETHQYPRRLGFVGMLAKFYNAVVGSDLTEADCLRTGERIVNLERLFNAREGLSRRHDTLPGRFLEEPMPSGPAAGEVVALERMLDQYYGARGWHRETGFPGREKLEELGLADLIPDCQLALLS